MTKLCRKFTENSDFSQEIVDIGCKIEEMRVSNAPMYNIIYNREELIKIFSLYARHLKELNKIINFKKESSHAGS